MHAMLFVDIDKSLIKSDYLIESFFNYFSRNIFAPFISLFILLLRGKVGLKKFLYNNSKISAENLPYNKQVLLFIHDWKNMHPDKEVHLISASYHKAVRDIATHLGYFDSYHGSDKENLKSEKKLKKILEICNKKNFTYIGDSRDDLIIWNSAEKCILVNPSKNLKKKVNSLNLKIEVLNKTSINIFKEIISTIRVHQWIKNILLFVPAVLAFVPLSEFYPNLIRGFIAFSFIASAFYILNDLFDIENDRVHSSKKFRAFASGSLSLIHGFYICVVLILIAILISLNLSKAFQICLILYAFSSFFYSKFLKKIPVIDILTLSFLYLLRIISGGALFSISISNWLLTFSVFFFLFLAAVKRWIELKKLDKDKIPGRGYQISDISFVSQLAYFSGLISVLVICLYIESQQAQAIINMSKIFWFIPVILLYWILKTLFDMERGNVDDDPVKYALKSKTSYFCLIASIIVLFSNTVI